MSKAGKKILVVSWREYDYPRNKLLISILAEFHDVENIYYNLRGIKNYLHLMRHIFKYGSSFDYIVLIQPAQKAALIIFFYKFFYKNKIVFDAFTSIFDTYFGDRKLIKKNSLKYFYYYCLDYLLCRAADIILFDTIEHQRYFVETFAVSAQKRKIIVPLCVDVDFIDNIAVERKDDNFFTVLFYGNFIPLQGIEYIIGAARILRNEPRIRFVLLGDGQEKKTATELQKKYHLNNVFFREKVAYSQLFMEIKKADVCLGVFGDTPKARRVIPNKLLESMACAKIVITGRNEAVSRFFKNGRDLIFCNMADIQDLAEKIKYTHDNFLQLRVIGEAAAHRVRENFSSKNMKKIILENL